MCLITDQQEPLIAQEDMIVYKILSYSLISLYTGFEYEYHKLYETEIKEQSKDDYKRYGYSHYDIIAYRATDDKYPNWTDYYHKELKCFNEGFHSASSVERLKVKTTLTYEIIFECTIPKGSEYYTDSTGLIVSNKIIINKEL